MYRLIWICNFFLLTLNIQARADTSLSAIFNTNSEGFTYAEETALSWQEISARPAATLEELQQVLADKCHARVSLSPISCSLQGLNLPRKKKPPRP